MVEVWRIAGKRHLSGRPKRRDQRTGARTGLTKSPPAHDKAKTGTRPARGKAGAQHKGATAGKHEPAVRPPRERPVDPDNPFAALAALKKNLEKTGDR